MNERIRELAQNAGFKPFDVREDDIKFKKFAELIVRECAQLAMTQHNSTSPDDYDEMDSYDKGCDDTSSRISGLIRRTFGVKE